MTPVEIVVEYMMGNERLPRDLVLTYRTATHQYELMAAHAHLPHDWTKEDFKIVREPERVALFREGLDEFTGTNATLAWLVELRGENEVHVDEVKHAEVGPRTRETRPPMWSSLYLIDQMGFQFLRDDGSLPELLGPWRKKLGLLLGRAPSFLDNDVMVRDDVFYIPETWIGCCGFLGARATGELLPISSGIGLTRGVWAFEKGISFGGTKADRLDTLWIQRINDPRKTQETLAPLLDVGRALEPLPLKMEGVDLVPFLDQLQEAENRRWFEFRVDRGHAPKKT